MRTFPAIAADVTRFGRNQAEAQPAAAAGRHGSGSGKQGNRTVHPRLRPALLAVMFALVVGSALADGPPAPTALPTDTIEQVAPDQVVALLGLAVQGADGKEVGRIVDVLVDQAGHPRAAVIDVGGFLGVGNRKVAVEWAALRFTMGKQASAILGIASETIKSAPAYDPAKPVQAIGLPEPTHAPVSPPAAKP
jgi:hypothetical protein